MAKRKHTPGEIINKLRAAEEVVAAGSTVAEASRRIGVSEQTFYRWRAARYRVGCQRKWDDRGSRKTREMWGDYDRTERPRCSL